MAVGIAAMAAVKGGQMAYKYFKNRNNDIKGERSQLLNRQNDFNSFLAKQAATDPTAALRDLDRNKRRAAQLSVGTFSNLGDIGKGNASGFTGPSKSAKQMAASLTDLNINNLSEDEKGLLQYIAPQLEQAISTKMAKKGADFGNFQQGGEQFGFGTKGGAAHEKEEKKGPGGILGFLEKMIPGFNKINRSVGGTVGKLPGVGNVMGSLGKVTPGLGRLPGA